MEYAVVIGEVKPFWRLYVALLVSQRFVWKIVQNVLKQHLKACPKYTKCNLWVKHCGGGGWPIPKD